MKQGRVRLVGVALLLLMVALFASGCGTSSSDGEKVVFGGSAVIEDGETVEGDLVVFGGNATVEEGGTVAGDVAVFGGNVDILGDVTGDLAAFGGNVEIDGRVAGDVAAFGGNVDSSEGEIGGEVAVAGGSERSENGAVPELPEVPAVPDGPELPEEPEAMPPFDEFDRDFRVTPPSFADRAFDLVSSVVQTIVTAIALGALALALALFMPEHVRRVGRAAQDAPIASAAVGCLAFPVVGLVGAIAAVTIIGLPLTALLALLLPAGVILGWIGLGYFFGDRVLRSADVRSPRPAAAAAIGAGGLVLVSGVASIIPFFGWILSPVLWVWGLGAAILTKGGTQPYPARALVGQSIPPLSYDPLDAVTPTPPPAQPRPARNDLFADLAADLGLDEEDLKDEDVTKPSQTQAPRRASDEETPLPPPV